jgi:hypothetical protein
VAVSICAASTVGCTGGFITNQDGSQWLPASPPGSTVNTGVVTIANGSGSYQVWAGVNQSDTIFSFDPGAPREFAGNYTINNNVQIPDGTYTFTVADTHVWQASGVTISNGGACPYGDYWNGQNTYCQLFQLQLLNCGVQPVPPYPSGNVTVVQLAQQCGPTCTVHDVKDVQGSFLVNPVIEEIYWGCPPGAGNGCQTSPNTGAWPALASETKFWSRMVEYGVGNGSYGGSFSDTPAGVGKFVSDAQIQTALLAELANGKVKSPYTTLNQTNAVIFVIYLPTTSCTSANGTSCNNEGAHHSSFKVNGQEIFFAVVDGSTDLNTLDAAATHEVEEAATDADPYNPGCGTNTGCGWNEPSTHQGEIGDLCSNNDSINGHSVAQVWSQTRCSCL